MEEPALSKFGLLGIPVVMAIRAGLVGVLNKRLGKKISVANIPYPRSNDDGDPTDFTGNYSQKVGKIAREPHTWVLKKEQGDHTNEMA
ncbi:hypothetical protein V499_04386 [Pseudogymnoascus sp. VKM F-103]|nr:hypothetical protein V499_04386 [Pseudogymnoascus sp. VKM F-103]